MHSARSLGAWQRPRQCRGLSVLPKSLSLLGRYRLDGREASPVAAIGELHPAADLGEQSVIGADAHVRPRLDLGAALADDDRSTGHELAAKSLDAQPLRIGITSVCGAASTLLMCHCRIPFSN